MKRVVIEGTATMVSDSGIGIAGHSEGEQPYKVRLATKDNVELREVPLDARVRVTVEVMENSQ